MKLDERGESVEFSYSDNLARSEHTLYNPLLLARAGLRPVSSLLMRSARGSGRYSGIHQPIHSHFVEQAIHLPLAISEGSRIQ